MEKLLFDENADNLDSYITRSSQSAMMLNYGEPQILELMKNTLPIRLYPILFPIDNLRDAIMTTKHVMIKDIIDRQKTGQCPATPFMHMNESGQTSKKGGTFDAMETLERHGNSIDRLTSLISKMNIKMDKKEVPYKPRVYQTDQEAIAEVVSKIFNPTIGPLAEIETEPEGITIIEIIDPTSEIDPGTVIDMTIEEIVTIAMRDAITTDRTIEGEKTIDKTIKIGTIIEEITLDKETGVRVEIG